MNERVWAPGRQPQGGRQSRGRIARGMHGETGQPRGQENPEGDAPPAEAGSKWATQRALAGREKRRVYA